MRHCLPPLASFFLMLAVTTAATTTCQTFAANAPLVESYLSEGELSTGAAELAKQISQSPDDQQARFSLGIIHFLQAIEGLGQAQHQFGLLQHRVRRVPLFRIPIPPNDKPEELSYEKARQIVADFLKDLEKAEATLAEVDTTEVKLPLHLGRVRLDLDGDGEATDEETFWRIFAMFDGRVGRDIGEAFRIGLDGGDVHWLRGYCHVAMSLCEFALAHDWREVFERCAHLIYPRVKTPHTFLADEQMDPLRWTFDFRLIADVIAYIHLLNFPVEEPDRMASALKHLHAVVAQSRASWTRILSETDDDGEWLPGPDQTGVIPGVRIRQEIIDGWHGVLDEAESILRGQKLIPFWRGYKEKPSEVFTQRRGINLKRVFTEPKRFDVVMWATGTGATPFLETGELTKRETWGRLTQIFGSNFLGFAFWFN